MQVIIDAVTRIPQISEVVPEELKGIIKKPCVDCQTFPDKRILEREFNFVSSLFDGREWILHASRKEQGHKKGEIEFWLAQPPQELWNDSEKIIAWADKLGYLPATHVELLAFARSFPDEQRKFWIVGYGAVILNNSFRYCNLLLRCDANGRLLDSIWARHRLDSDDRVLLVRK